MTQKMAGCIDLHETVKIYLKVDGKYVIVQHEDKKKINLFAKESQDPRFVWRKTCTRHNIKYVAFHFRYGSKCYSLKEEGGTLQVVDLSCKLNGQNDHHFECSNDFAWFVMKNIEAGESHLLKTQDATLQLSGKTFMLSESIDDVNATRFTFEEANR